ncbi:MAG: hypothetical protein OER74_19065 [Desulfobacteraceae bacterium]|nr:hypothetical protein [Desulfobacteraceae bacterium]
MLQIQDVKGAAVVIYRTAQKAASATGILKYVEELKRGANAEVRPKDYSEIASIFF